MARTLFFCMVLRKSADKPIFSTRFFTIINISFFSLRFDLFSIIAKEVNQIRSNVVCAVARLVSLFCCAFTTGRCNAFQHIFHKLKQIVVLRPIFPDYVISCDYAQWLAGVNGQHVVVGSNPTWASFLYGITKP